MECFNSRFMKNYFFHESPCTLWLNIKCRVWKLVFVKYHIMRSTEVHKLKLVWTEKNREIFRDIGDGLRITNYLISPLQWQTNSDCSSTYFKVDLFEVFTQFESTLVSVKMDQLKSRDDIQSKFVLEFITKIYLNNSHSVFLVLMTQGSPRDSHCQ